MKRFILPAILLATLASFNGCRQSDEGTAKETTNLLDMVAQDDAPTDQEIMAALERARPVQGGVSALNKSEEDFSKRIAQLTLQANKYENAREYDNALKTWSTIQTEISSRYGPESWQATNVRVAVKTAQAKAKFNPQQEKILLSIDQLQIQINKALNEKNFSQAYDACLQSAQMTQIIFGSDSYRFARMQTQLGQISLYNQQPELAISYFEKALQILKQQLGNVHPDVEVTTFSIGQVYQQTNRNAEAIPYLAEATNLSRKIWGESELNYAARSHELGVAYHRDKKFDRAIDFLSIAEKIRREKLNKNHPQLAHCLRNLSVVYQDQKKFQQAAEKMKAAIDIFMDQFGPTNAFTIDAQTKYATQLTILKDYVAAEKVFQELAKTQKKMWSDKHPLYAQTLYRLGAVQAYQKKYDQAEPNFVQAYQIQKTALGERNSETQLTVAAYAKLLDRTGRDALATQIRNGIRTVGFDQELKK
jgi:tetratricopeptide (TPR) repeat protein